MVRMDPTILFWTGGHSREALTHSFRVREHGEHYFSDFLGPGSPVTWKNHRGISAYRRRLAREGRAGDRKQERHARRIPRLSGQIFLFSELGSRDQEYSTRFRTGPSHSKHGLPSIIENRVEQKTG